MAGTPVVLGKAQGKGSHRQTTKLWLTIYEHHQEERELTILRSCSIKLRCTIVDRNFRPPGAFHFALVILKRLAVAPCCLS